MSHFVTLSGIISETLQNNGGTFAVTNAGNRIVATSNPFALGYYVATGAVASGSDSLVIPQENLDQLDLAAFINVNWYDLTNNPDRLYLGTWVHDGVCYLELARHFDGLEDALQFARFNNQVAIWDILNNCEVKALPPERTEGPLLSEVAR